MRIFQTNILKQFMKYAVVGVIGTSIQSAVLILLVEKLGFNPLIGSVIGFVFSLIVSYYINNKWTFNSANSFLFYKYTIVSISGLLLNLVIMFLMINIIGVWYVWAQGVVIIVVPVSNFILNRYWAFA